jgi:hypothetical protein
MSSRQMKEVEIALEVDAVATSELNVEVPCYHGVPCVAVLGIRDILVGYRYEFRSADPCLWLMGPDPDPGGPKHTDQESDPDLLHCQ